MSQFSGVKVNVSVTLGLLTSVKVTVVSAVGWEFKFNSIVAFAPVRVREKVPDWTLTSKVKASSLLISIAPELTNLTISMPA